MGTRADFYVGIDSDARWLGSIAWDGYPEGMPDGLLESSDEGQFIHAVAELLSSRNDATLPEHGWPWPWDDSRTTDFAYAFHDGCVYSNRFGRGWENGANRERNRATHISWADEGWVGDEPVYEFAHPSSFPDMSSVKSVTIGKRSGLFFVGVPK